MQPVIKDEVRRRERIAEFLGAAERVAFAKILWLGLATLCILFLWDALVFRSGFYVRYLEPASAAGSFETVFRGGMKGRFGRPHRALCWAIRKSLKDFPRNWRTRQAPAPDGSS